MVVLKANVTSKKPTYDLFLYLLFGVSCFAIGLRIHQEFRDGFDWFSGALYFIIFVVSCGLLYVSIFGIYYALVD